MGLNKRRKIEKLKTVAFPARVKEIEEICSLTDDAEALNFIDNEVVASLLKQLIIFDR